MSEISKILAHADEILERSQRLDDEALKEEMSLS